MGRPARSLAIGKPILELVLLDRTIFIPPVVSQVTIVEGFWAGCTPASEKGK